MEGWDEKRAELEASRGGKDEVWLSVEREWRSFWRATIPGPYRDATEDFIRGFENALSELYKEVRGVGLRSLLT